MHEKLRVAVPAEGNQVAGKGRMEFLNNIPFFLYVKIFFNCM